MKKILLTSGGFDNKNVADKFLELVNKPVNEIKKCTKNKTVINISTFIIKLFYTLIFIAIAIYVLYDKLPI